MKARFKYAKICQDVTRKIQKGAFPDKRLPSVRSLAKAYRVSLLTAYKSVKILESQGLIRCQPDGKSTVILARQQSEEFHENDHSGHVHAVIWNTGKTRVKIKYLYPEYDSPLRKAWSGIIEDFEKRYPWIEIVPVNSYFSDPGNINRARYDVVQIGSRDLRCYYDYGWTTRLDDLIKNDRSLKTEIYHPQALETCRINDEFHALPQSITMPLIYYKPELLSAGQRELIRSRWTWKDFRDISETLRNKAQGVALNVGLLTLLSYFDYESLRRMHFGQNSFMLREALELLRSVVRQLPKRTKLSNIYQISNVAQRFAEDKIGMFLGYMPHIPDIMRKRREGWDIARPPQEANGKPVFTAVLNIIDAHSVCRNESWLFLKHISSRGVLERLLAEKIGMPSILDRSNDNPLMARPPDSMRILPVLLSDSQPLRFSSRLSEIIYRTVFYPYLKEWLAASRPDDEIWDDICRRYNKLLEVYN